MAPRADVLDRMRRVRTLRFDASSGSDSGWDGIGVGFVTVTEPSPGVMVFDESGVWRPTGRAEMRFTNVFRWTAAGDRLRLDHLRLGADRPVFLFDMAPDPAGNWRDVSPHLCRTDCYSAELGFDGDHLVIAWSVNGPKKAESIRYVYW